MKEQEWVLSHQTDCHMKERDALYRIYFPVKWKCVGQYIYIRTFTPIISLLYIMIAHICSICKYFLKIIYIFGIFLTNAIRIFVEKYHNASLCLSEPLHQRPVRHIPAGD